MMKIEIEIRVEKDWAIIFKFANYRYVMNGENYRACVILDTLNFKLLKWQFLKIEVTG